MPRHQGFGMNYLICDQKMIIGSFTRVLFYVSIRSPIALKSIVKAHHHEHRTDRKSVVCS